MTAVIDRIKAEVEGHPVVLFMKGTPQFPMCGFSSRASEALKKVGAQIHSVNVLQDPEIRADLPRFSDFPFLVLSANIVCEWLRSPHPVGLLSITRSQL